MSPEKLRRRALALGAELEIDGKTINAGRQQLRVVQPRAVPQAATAPAPEAAPAQSDAMAMMAQAMTLQTQIAAAQAEGTMRVLAELVDRVLGKAPQAAPAAKKAAPEPQALNAPAAIEAPAAPTAAAPAVLIMPVSFKVLRDTTGWAQGLEPTYGEVSSAHLAGLRTTADSRGLIDTITPSYA